MLSCIQAIISVIKYNYPNFHLQICRWEKINSKPFKLEKIPFKTIEDTII